MPSPSLSIFSHRRKLKPHRNNRMSRLTHPWASFLPPLTHHCPLCIELLAKRWCIHLPRAVSIRRLKSSRMPLSKLSVNSPPRPSFKRRTLKRMPSISFSKKKRPASEMVDSQSSVDIDRASKRPRLTTPRKLLQRVNSKAHLFQSSDQEKSMPILSRSLA